MATPVAEATPRESVMTFASTAAMDRTSHTALNCSVPSGRWSARVHRIVGAGGFEPPTSSVSGKRSPPELSARMELEPRRGGAEAGTGIDPVYGALQAPA